MTAQPSMPRLGEYTPVEAMVVLCGPDSWPISREKGLIRTGFALMATHS